MYICIAAIIAILVGIITFVAAETNPKMVKEDQEILRQISKGCLIFALIVAIGFGISAINSRNLRQEHQAEYADLMLYKEMVDTTSNEYVRFDYYQKVEDWNERYAKNLELEANPWLSWFVTDEFAGTHPIVFELHK